MLLSHRMMSTLLSTFKNESVCLLCDGFLLLSSLELTLEVSSSSRLPQISPKGLVESMLLILLPHCHYYLKKEKNSTPWCLKESKAKEGKGVRTKGHLTRRKLVTASSSFSCISPVVSFTSRNTVRFLSSLSTLLFKDALSLSYSPCNFSTNGIGIFFPGV